MKQIILLIMLCLCSGFLTPQAWMLQALGAEVMGDGKKENGIEDDRMPLAGLQTEVLKQIRPVGVIRCQGQVIGSGVIVKANKEKALILTAGHVVTGKRDCQFFPYDMYQGHDFKIELLNKKSTPENFEGDIALLSAKGDFSAFGQVNLYARSRPVRSEMPAMLIGYQNSYRAMVASLMNCVVLKKLKKGLASDQPSVGLDSCDSGHGASGGALFILKKSGEIKLFAVRTGYLFKAENKDDKALKGDEAKASRYANTHHVITKSLRSLIRKLWAKD